MRLNSIQTPELHPCLNTASRLSKDPLLPCVLVAMRLPDTQLAACRLRVNFGADYPLAPPEIYFEASQEYQPPVHNHIYSNGVTCSGRTALLSPSA